MFHIEAETKITMGFLINFLDYACWYNSTIELIDIAYRILLSQDVFSVLVSEALQSLEDYTDVRILY